MGDRDGRVRELRRDVQQLHDPPGRRPNRSGRHLRAVLPAAPRGADGGDHPLARGAPGGPAAGVRAQAGGCVVSYDALPGFAGLTESFGETTVTIEAARIREACTYARDELGFAMLVALAPTAYLGWGAKGVSGYIATASGRDINFPSTQAPQTLPAPEPKRFSGC